MMWIKKKGGEDKTRWSPLGDIRYPMQVNRPQPLRRLKLVVDGEESAKALITECSSKWRNTFIQTECKVE